MKKAFCAGGDIRRLHQSVMNSDHGPNDYGETFFTKEYRLDHLIHTFSKPIICWGAGIVMGGGIGLMAGASHRVVTPSSKLAMPEVSIGLFPDVGGSWILGRMPGRVGLFLGLTGTRVNAADALFVGLADRFLNEDSLDQVVELLLIEDWSDLDRSNHLLVDDLLRRLESQQKAALPESPVREYFDIIQAVTDADSPMEILERLKTQEGDYWQRAAAGLEKGCPLTAWLVLSQIRAARHLSLADVFRLELNMAVHCLRGRNFAEGVRALLLERGSAPEWSPASLEEVDSKVVEEYFNSFWLQNEHPFM